MSEVVVVFPFEPVIQTIFASVYRPANSISEMMGVPFSFNFIMSGASLGIPGLFTTSSAFRISSSVWCPSSQAMPYLSSSSSFVCANDFVAMDLVKALDELGYSVPDDIWVCGFDDSQEASYFAPRLTSIHIHGQIMGYTAANLLMTRIEEPSLNYRTVYTETNLILRESTGD